MNHLPWLSLLVFFPLVAAALVALLPAQQSRLIRLVATGAALVEFVRPAFELAIGNLFEVVAQGAHDSRGPPGPLLGQVVRDVGVHQGQRFGDGFAPAFQRGVHPLAQVLHVVHAHRIESGHVRGYGTRHGQVDHHERINPVGEVGGAQQRLGGLNGHQHQTSTRGLRRQVGERSHPDPWVTNRGHQFVGPLHRAIYQHDVRQ